MTRVHGLCISGVEEVTRISSNQKCRHAGVQYQKKTRRVIVAMMQTYLDSSRVDRLPSSRDCTRRGGGRIGRKSCVYMSQQV